MSFVHQGYLWFLGLLVIPVLIHLFYFRRHKRLYFPSLKYLKQQEQEKKTVKNLKRRLILACRLLLISSIIFAFAQPKWNSNNPVKNGVSITVIYLDNSYSMSAKGVEGILLSECKEVAKRIVLEGNSKTRYMLCSNALSGIERKIHTKSTAIRYIDELPLNRMPRKLSTVLNFQEEYLQRYHREIAHIATVQRILLSDFQKKSAVLDGYEAKKLPFPIKTNVLQTVAQKLENRTIDSVWTDAPVHKPGKPLKLFFRVKNCSKFPVENLGITLQFDGKKRMTNLSLKPNESGVSYFNVSPMISGYLDGKLSISDPTLNWDDDFYFTHRSAKSSKVLIVNGDGALNNPQRVFDTEPFYATISKNETSFSSRDLVGIDLLVLNELSSIPSGTSSMIFTFIANGGSAFILPSVNINLNEYNALLKSFGLSPFKGTTKEGNQVASFSYRSMFFRGMFEKEKKELNLPLAKSVYTPGNNQQSNAEILIQLRNRLPLLLHQRYNGNVFLLTASPNETNGGISQHAIYPSMLLRAAEISIRSLPMYHMLGQTSKLTLEHSGNTDEPVKVIKNKDEFIPRQIQSGNLLNLQLNTPEFLERMSDGIYEVTGTDQSVKIGVNLNRDESLLEYMDKAGIQNAFSKIGLNNIDFDRIDRGASSFNLKVDKPSSFWEIFVILALIFALAEMAVIKFMTP
jgi:hypothetical protein